MRRRSWVGWIASSLTAVMALVRCVGDSPNNPGPDAGVDTGADVGPGDSGDSGAASWCAQNRPQAQICDDFDNRALSDFAKAGWTAQTGAPLAKLSFITTNPVSAPNALRASTEPFTTGTQLFATENYTFPTTTTDGGSIDRVVVEFSVRVQIHDPGPVSPMVTLGFKTSTGPHYFAIWLGQSDVTGGDYSGHAWTFPNFFDTAWHTVRVVAQRADGGFGLSVTADGKLLVAANPNDGGDAGVEPVNPQFLALDGLELGLHVFPNTDARQIDLDNAVVSY